MRWMLALVAALIVAVLLFAVAPRFAGVEETAYRDVEPLFAAVPAGTGTVVAIPRYAAFIHAISSHPAGGTLWNALAPAEASILGWVAGNAKVVVWSGENHRGAVTDAGVVRTAFLRLALIGNGARFTTANGYSVVVLGDVQPGGFAIEAVRPANAHAWFLVPKGSKLSLPTLDPPAVTSVRLDSDAIRLETTAFSRPEDAVFAPPLPIPANAMLVVNSGKPPRLLKDLDRIVPGDLREAMAAGGQIALYGIEPKALFPRPLGVIAVPRGSSGGPSFTAEALGFSIEETIVGDRRVIAFDRGSGALYRDAEFNEPELPAGTLWYAEIDPGRLVPALRAIEDHDGMRLLARRAHRVVRNTLRWLGPLEGAGRIILVRRSAPDAELLSLELRAAK
ncbi:MAG: hypothetical protein ACYC7A_05115 [Thermoanaerobaculia bacterium]